MRTAAMEKKKSAWVLVIAVLVVALLSSCSTGRHPARVNQDPMHPAPSGTGGAPETVHEKNGWKLIIQIVNQGTWSQGYRGYLFHCGRRIAGKPGEVLQTSLGELHWLGMIWNGQNILTVSSISQKVLGLIEDKFLQETFDGLRLVPIHPMARAKGCSMRSKTRP